MKLVLVIDDDPIILGVMEKQLGALGYRVVTSQFPEKGLELADSGNPDLIILDIELPGMNGIQVLSQLRKNPVTKRTPVIMITGESHRERVLEAMQLGVDDYLLKPYSHEQLTEKLESAFSWNVLNQLRTDDDPALEVERRDGRIVIKFIEKLGDQGTGSAFNSLADAKFLSSLVDQIIVFDLRMLPAIEPNEVGVLEEFVKKLSRPVDIVAGRNFGVLLDPLLDKSETIRLHLSFGDLSLWHGKHS